MAERGKYWESDTVAPLEERGESFLPVGVRKDR